MDAADPAIGRGCCHDSLGIRLQYIEIFHYLQSDTFPLLDSRFPSVGGTVME